jgi:integrase
MEQRGLAPSTIDRRLATVCGLYRFAHIDGRIASNPAQYVRRPKVHPSQGHGMDRTELGRFLFTAEQLGHQRAALAVLLGLNGLRVSEACETDIGDLGSTTGDERTSTGTPPTSSSHSSPEHESRQSAPDGQTSKNEQRVPGAFASLASAVRSATSSVSARAT